MADPKLSRLFERYRTHSDLAALAEVFDAVGPELLRVARHVAGKRTDPEDLVQATFLAAIEKAQTFDAERPLVPWLLGILINQSRLARRRQVTNLDEQAFQPAVAGDQHESVVTSELEIAVSRALDTLPDTYREVLLPHLGEGKKPVDIARELGRPQGTVRAQIHRGIRMMRKSIPAGLAAGGAAAWFSRSTLEHARSAVLEEAARQTGQSTAGLGSGSGALGRFFASKEAAFGGLAVAVISALFFVLDPSAFERPIPTPEVHHPAVVEAGDPHPPLLDSPSEERMEAALAVAEPRKESRKNDASFGSVEVHVVRGRDGPPAPNIQVTLLPWGEKRWYENGMAGRTDERGILRFAQVHAGRIGIQVDAHVQKRDLLAAGENKVVVLEIEPSLRVHVTVVDDAGHPVHGALVTDHADPAEPPTRTLGPTGSDGRLEIEDADPRHWLSAKDVDRDGARRAARLVWLGHPGWATAREAQIVLALGTEGLGLVGSVRTSGGDPIPGARIEALPTTTEGPLWRDFGALALDPPAVFAESKAHGAFVLRGLPATPLLVRIHAAGFAPFEQRVHPGQLAFERLDARLALGGVVRGVARTSTGEIAAHARLAIDVSGLSLAIRAQCASDGSFALDNVPIGQHLFRARSGEFGPESRTELLVAERAELEWNPIVEDELTIRGRVVGEDGRLVKMWLVRAVPALTESLEPESEAGFLGRWTRDNLPGDSQDLRLQSYMEDDGIFVVPCRGRGPHRLELRPRAMWTGPAYAVQSNVLPGTEGVVMRVSKTWAKLSGRIVDERGRALTSCLVVAAPTDGSGDASARTEAPQDEFSFRLLPGVYDLVAWPSERTPVHLGRIQLTEGEVRALGDVRLPEQGNVALRVDAGLSAPLAPLTSVLVGVSGLRHELHGAGAHAFAGERLAAGKYFWFVRAADGVEREQTIVVRAGETIEAAIVW